MIRKLVYACPGTKPGAHQRGLSSPTLHIRNFRVHHLLDPGEGTFIHHTWVEHIVQLHTHVLLRRPDVPWIRRWSSNKRWSFIKGVGSGWSRRFSWRFCWVHMDCREAQMMSRDRHKNKDREFPSSMSPEIQWV
ncbi:hypothetical protein BDW72DRAFT_54341 [Aspergillus terricola var. indicus]